MPRFFLKYISFMAGCFLCRFFQIEWHVPPVMAAALIGFGGTFIKVPSVSDTSDVHSAIYAGSFAGMCSMSVLSSYEETFILSMILTVLFILTRSIAVGFGGKLGTLAFLSSLIFFIGKNVW